MATTPTSASHIPRDITPGESLVNEVEVRDIGDPGNRLAAARHESWPPCPSFYLAGGATVQGIASLPAGRTAFVTMVKWLLGSLLSPVLALAFCVAVCAAITLGVLLDLHGRFRREP